MRAVPFLSAALSAVAVATLSAQDLVRDIRPSQLLSLTSGPQQFCAAANRVWFQANDIAHGTELWSTDGTTNGTQLFADLAPGPLHGSPSLLTPFAGGLAFATADGLCWTNTQPGNVVVLGVHAANDSTSGRPFAVGQRLFFVATFQPTGRELWATDGTPGGTGLVADIVPGFGNSSPRSFCELNGVLYFAATDASFSTRLWRSDGTAAGTFEVAPAAPYGNCEEVAVAGGRVFFGSWITHELWTSDGTAAGTTLLRSGFSSGPVNLKGGASKLVFVAGSAATGGEAWTSDGTPAGTQLLADALPGAGGFVTNFAVFGNRVLFGADDGVHGIEPWITDLTPAGTMMLADLNPGAAWSSPAYGVAFGNGIYFDADGGSGPELWFTDGTPAGTRLVRDINPNGGADPASFASIGALTVFSADDGVHGREPWVTDGTTAGTRLLRDLASVPLGSDPGLAVPIGKRTVFAADDGVHGEEPWVTDGTTAGTTLLIDTVPGAATGSYGFLGRWRGRLWFASRNSELWSTDGTPAGTTLVANVGAMMPYIRWFVGLDDRAIVGGDVRLCVTDGTAAGTTLLPVTNLTSLADGTRLGGFAYFTAADSRGTELWRTDGTAAGTTLVFEFTPGPDGSRIHSTAVGDRLYLSASSGVSLTFPFGALDFEPWVSDGTVAGTQRLGDLAPGTGSSFPYGFVAFAGRVWFTALDASGVSLYHTDGTPAGTTRFFGLTQMPRDLTVAGARLFFQNAGEVWSTDGTPAGTFASLDIAPGAADSQTRDFTALGASTELAFTAVVPGQPRTLWLTDGTVVGTRQLPGLTFPDERTALRRNGADVFVSGDDGFRGRELHALRLRSENASMADLLGDGCRGTAGTPRMLASAGPRLGSAFAIDLDRALPIAPAFAVHSFGLVPGGDRAGCAPALDLSVGTSLFFLTDGNGRATTSLLVPNAPFVLGLEAYSQWVVVDPAGGFLGFLATSPVLDWLVGS